MNILDRAFHRFAILAATLNLPGAVDPEEVVLVQNSTEELVDSLATRGATVCDWGSRTKFRKACRAETIGRELPLFVEALSFCHDEYASRGTQSERD